MINYGLRIEIISWLIEQYTLARVFYFFDFSQTQESLTAYPLKQASCVSFSVPWFQTNFTWTVGFVVY
jgi:hypothetical protein